jgi:hypothetical protein
MQTERVKVNKDEVSNINVCNESEEGLAGSEKNSKILVKSKLL